MARTRILVVDDDVAMCQLIADQLSDVDYEPVPAVSVCEAVRLMERAHFGLVLSDVQMPSKDGFELLRVIRAKWPTTSVILMSSFPAPGTAKKALEAGATAFLSKPFALEALRNALTAPRAP